MIKINTNVSFSFFEVGKGRMKIKSETSLSEEHLSNKNVKGERKVAKYLIFLSGGIILS